MRRPLERVLRVRRTLTSIERAAFAGELQRQRLLEKSLQAEQAQAAEARHGYQQALVEGEAWQLSRQAGEFSQWCSARLEPALRLQQERSSRAEGRYLASRQESKQVEVLVEQQMAEAREREGRLEQQLLDEWFLSREGRKR